MRKTTRFKIDDVEITVKELTVADIIGLGEEVMGTKDAETGEAVGGLDPTATGILAFLEKNLSLGVEGIDIAGLRAMAPSDLEEIFNKFKAVNKTFFGLAQQLGVPGMLGDLKKVMQKEFSSLLVDLSKPGTPTA